MDWLEILGAIAIATPVAVAGIIKGRRMVLNGRAQADEGASRQLHDVADALADTASRLLSPQGMTDAILRIDRRVESLSDRSNGHGAARREHLERLERKLDRTVSKVDAISEQVSEVRADVAYLKGARESDDIVKVPVMK